MILGTGKRGRLGGARRPKIRTEISISASGSIGTEILKSASNSAVRSSPDPLRRANSRDSEIVPTSIFSKVAKTTKLQKRFHVGLSLQVGFETSAHNAANGQCGAAFFAGSFLLHQALTGPVAQ